MSLTVYGFPDTRSLRVTWMLEELGLDYDYHLVNMAKGESRSPEYLAVNPAGKVPALKTEHGILIESVAIINYLGALKPDEGLIPTHSLFERARYDQWCLFAVAELEQPLWTIGKNKFALPKAQRCPEIFPTAEWEFQKALGLFSEALGDNPYILGAHFSAADILLAHTLFWGRDFKQKIEAKNLQAYMQHIQTRPALAAAVKKEKSALGAA
jgi:glutathione S-transferase